MTLPPGTYTKPLADLRIAIEVHIRLVMRPRESSTG